MNFRALSDLGQGKVKVGLGANGSPSPFLQVASDSGGSQVTLSAEANALAQSVLILQSKADAIMQLLNGNGLFMQLRNPPAVVGQTCIDLFAYTGTSGTPTQNNVTLGAADSGGAGFRVLRVANG